MSLDTQQAVSLIQLQFLQTKVNSLEDQLQQALATSKKREAYANTLAVDLEHIILQLNRLEVVKPTAHRMVSRA